MTILKAGVKDWALSCFLSFSAWLSLRMNSDILSLQKQRLLRHLVQQPFCMWKMLPVQSVIAWGGFYGFCKRHFRRICTLLHAQKSTRKAPATFEAREARTRGCSPLVTPKRLGSIQKIQAAALEDFLCSAGLKSLRDGHSRQRQMPFFVTTLSGENANRKNPQIFSICEIKILFPLFMARAKRRPF